MLKQISKEIRTIISQYDENDNLIFNNQLIPISKVNFISIPQKTENKTIGFIDGGQCEIITTGNFCLSFIRVYSQIFQNNFKKESLKYEFYLLTKAIWKNENLFYESKIYSEQEKIIDENDLLINSTDETIRTGIERAPITKVTNMARRFAELALAQKTKADIIIFDGTLQAMYKREEKYLLQLNENIGAIAKSSSLFTTSGNNPTILLNKMGPTGCWLYRINNNSSFVKLHPLTKHIFRYEGNTNNLSNLINNCSDALFLGYPYGLILADKMARVSNQEKKSVMTRFLLDKENKEIISYLNSSNAHEILDRMG